MVAVWLNTGTNHFPGEEVGGGSREVHLAQQADLIVGCLNQALQGLDTPGYAMWHAQLKLVHGLG